MDVDVDVAVDVDIYIHVCMPLYTNEFRTVFIRKKIMKRTMS